MPIHPWGVDHSAVRRAVELPARRRAVLRPALLIPVRGIDRTASPFAGSGLDPFQHLTDGRGVGELNAAHPHTGRRGVDMGINEGRRDQRPVELDDRINPVTVAQ